MKKYIFLCLIFLFPISLFASWDYAKDTACKLSDGVYTKNLQVTYPWYITEIRNFMKTENSLFYVVNSFQGDRISINHDLYTYDCKTKKAKLLAWTISGRSDGDYAEIDYLNSQNIFIRFLGESMDGEFYPTGDGYLVRKTNTYIPELSFANEDVLMQQYVQDFGPINGDSFGIKDITTWKDKKLLVWITWGSDMLRALSVDPKTFTASNVAYDYSFKKQDNSNAWLKLQWGNIYEKNNAGSWTKVAGVDLKTFRAIQSNYGRDKNGYTLYNSSKNLSKDAVSKGYHMWYSKSQWKIYSYNQWDWKSIKVQNPDSLYFHDYFGFNDPNSTCTDTTWSYGYVAEDTKYCYGEIAWSSADFGIVGSIK